MIDTVTASETNYRYWLQRAGEFRDRHRRRMEREAERRFVAERLQERERLQRELEAERIRDEFFQATAGTSLDRYL